METTTAPAIAAVLVPLILAAGVLVARYGEPLKRLDLERLYLHVLAAVFCFWTISSVSVWSRSRP